MSNYTLADLGQISWALLIWFLLSVGQGLVIGHLSNVFGFRSRSFLKQLSLAAVLSLGVLPCLYYLSARICGLNGITVLNLAFLTALIVIIIRQTHLFRLLRDRFWIEIAANKLFLLANVIWIALGTAMLIDFQIDDKLYLNMTMYDHSLKVAFADAINRTGIPPSNPSFHPGYSIAAAYHYYWPMLCSVISTMCGSPYNTRAAVIAGILWTGLVFLSFLSLYSNYFKTINVPARQITLVTVALLVVSNLYIIFVLPANLILQLHHAKPLPSICWWGKYNDIVDPLLSSMLWLPHNIAGLIAGMLGSILILEASRQEQFQARVCSTLLAGICLASNFGLSAYTAIGFAITWIAWAVLALYRKNTTEFATTIGAGTISLFLTLPFFCELHQAHQFNTSLILGTRKFAFIHSFPVPDVVREVLYLLALPLNYFVGFGFLLLGALLYWRQRGTYSRSLPDRKESFLILMTCVSILLGSFVRNQVDHNDFGWRIVLLTNLTMLLWSAQFLCSRWQQQRSLKLSAFNWLLIGIGIATCIYALFLDRTSPAIWHKAERTYAIRAIYQALDNKLLQTAILQPNPNPNEFFGVEMYNHLYSHRQEVISDSRHDARFVRSFGTVPAEIERLFDNPPLSEAIDICRRYKIDVILVKDTDKIWSNKSAWIWKFPIIVANKYAAAFLVNSNNRTVLKSSE